MELRRALLLFAIVLAVAAIVSSIARPPERGGDRAATAPAGDAPATASPPTRSARPKTVELPADGGSQTRKVEVGQPATLLVDVAVAGQVEIPSLGLIEPAEPLTPALFEILVSEPGSHPILVQPAGTATPAAKVGTLKVVPPS